MKEKDLKRLSRADLLEMLIDQSKEMQVLRDKLEQAQEELKKREIAIQNAGSIAEASLMLNGVFEAAQAACREYVENTHKYCEPHGPFGASVYEAPVYDRPSPTRPSETNQGIPYTQFLRQQEEPQSMRNSYVRPLQRTSGFARGSGRTERYLNAVESVTPKR